MASTLVGGPLLGTRQRNIDSDFTSWDLFEPIITPTIGKGNNRQRFILLPHAQQVTVLAYRTGQTVATLTIHDSTNATEAVDTSIQSVTLLEYTPKVTAQQVLWQEDRSGHDSDDDNEMQVDNTLSFPNEKQVLVMVGCKDGSLQEFLLNDLLESTTAPASSTSALVTLAPRRIIQLSRGEPILLLTAPNIPSSDNGILLYVVLCTKGLESTGTAANSKQESKLNVTVLRVLLPHFDTAAGSSPQLISMLSKDEIQRKWQLDKIQCRVGHDKAGGFLNTAPFRLVTVVQPSSQSQQDSTILVTLARANTLHVYYDHAREYRKYAPMVFPMPPENPICSIAAHPSDLACGHYHGEITILNNLWQQVQDYHVAMDKQRSQNQPLPQDPRSNLLTTKVHWHAHAVASLLFDSSGGAPLNDPMLYSGGEESALVTWQPRGKSKPTHVLPRIALGNMIHIAMSEKAGDGNARGILVYSDDNSLCLFEAHNKSRLWKRQGLPVQVHAATSKVQNLRKPILQMDPRAKDTTKASLVAVGLPQAPGLIQWYDIQQERVTHSLEVAPFNRVSQTEDEVMPEPSIVGHVFMNQGKELITIDESPTENLFVGAYDGTHGIVSTIRFWEANDQGDPPYVATASMAYPHGPKYRVSALGATQDATKACTVSNGEHTFRLWEKMPPSGDTPANRTSLLWTCRCKVTIPSGFSNLRTGRSAVAFSGDGSIVAIGFGSMVTLWDWQETRFLTSLRHLEGVQGTIEKIEFLEGGSLGEYMLIQSEYGVSLSSPFGARGSFPGWSWEVPQGTKHTKVSDAIVVSDEWVALTIVNTLSNTSRLVWIQAASGERFDSPTDVGSKKSKKPSKEYPGCVVSMVTAKRAETSSSWSKDDSSSNDVSMRILALANTGDLMLFSSGSIASLSVPTSSFQTVSVEQGPTLDVSWEGGTKRKARDFDNAVLATHEPAKKLSALDVFGLANADDNKGALPTTSQLPLLSKNFVRAFVGRGLARSQPQQS
eukprot:Nitzschia sp. Nitz4//scaffold133_size116822//31997//34999//NITZ4_003801-RA/size116822-processed-gene-0.27-mRNA-1//1//CDS//3329535378//7707//frame0